MDFHRVFTGFRRVFMCFHGVFIRFSWIFIGFSWIFIGGFIGFHVESNLCGSEIPSDLTTWRLAPRGSLPRLIVLRGAQQPWSYNVNPNGQCWQSEPYRKTTRKQHLYIYVFIFLIWCEVSLILLDSPLPLHLSFVFQFLLISLLCYSIRNHLLSDMLSHPTWVSFQNPHSKDELRR